MHKTVRSQTQRKNTSLWKRLRNWHWQIARPAWRSSQTMPRQMGYPGVPGVRCWSVLIGVDRCWSVLIGVVCCLSFECLMDLMADSKVEFSSALLMRQTQCHRPPIGNRLRLSSISGKSLVDGWWFMMVYDGCWQWIWVTTDVSRSMSRSLRRRCIAKVWRSTASRKTRNVEATVRCRETSDTDATRCGVRSAASQLHR